MNTNVTNIIKASIVLAALTSATTGLTGCGPEGGFGIKLSDSVIMGTKSFLAEVNRGRGIELPETVQGRRES